MKFLKLLVLGFFGLFVLLVVVGLFLPRHIHVERDILIDAPRYKVATVLSTFKTFNHWSPWASRDPQTRYLYEGPHAGPGAIMHWESNHPEVGSGSQEIIRVVPGERIETRLDFGDQGTADAYFQLSETDTGTRVVWGFDTDFGYNLIGRYVGQVMDAMLGPDYEAGLVRLKNYVESLPAGEFDTLDVAYLQQDAQTIVATAGQSSQQAAAHYDALRTKLGLVRDAMEEKGMAPVGPPLVIYSQWQAEPIHYRAAWPINSGAADLNPPVMTDTVAAGHVLRVVHTGSYDQLFTSLQRLTAYAKAAGYQPRSDIWVQFVDDAADTPLHSLRTHLYLPVK